MKTNISLEEAQALLLELVEPKECGVPIAHVVGRILSQDIRAPIHLPPFDKSPLDGYALQAKDTVEACSAHPVTLEVIGEVRAGYTSCNPVTSGTAIKVIVPTALNCIGADVLFWKVDMKPGSPVIAAQYNNKLAVGLSGNPAAAFITFDLIVVPLIKKMMGFTEKLPLKISAILADNFKKPSGQRRFLRTKLQTLNGINYVKLTGGQSNGVLKSMVECNALIDVPAGAVRSLQGKR